MLAVIGGSGFTGPPGARDPELRRVETPYGETSAPLAMGEGTVFLSRHGEGHRYAPHQVNYRANIWALREVGAERVVALNSVGSLRTEWRPGTIVVPDQIIDYTWGREQTFSAAGEGVLHTDFTHPYTESVREQILAGASAEDIEAVNGATYGCVQGPRFETAAEIARMRRDGCDLVGMTGMPEAILARELDLPYAVIAAVGNLAAGLAGPRQELDHDAIVAASTDARDQVQSLLAALI